jgi:hypothetical protein
VPHFWAERWPAFADGINVTPSTEKRASHRADVLHRYGEQFVGDSTRTLAPVFRLREKSYGDDETRSVLHAQGHGRSPRPHRMRDVHIVDYMTSDSPLWALRIRRRSAPAFERFFATIFKYPAIAPTLADVRRPERQLNESR